MALRIIENRVIFRDGEYNCFPSIAELPDGRVICAFRHARERQQEFGRVSHVDPTADDVFVVSEDGGRTFGKSLHTIHADEQSEQDPCVNLLSDGTLITTFFRWDLAPAGKGAEVFGETMFKTVGRTVYDRWDAVPSGTCWSVSKDGGNTWSFKGIIDVPGYVKGTAARGNIVELADGTLLLPMYGCKEFAETSRVFVVKSTDRGESWEYLSDIAYVPGLNFVEPSFYLTESGKLIALLRTQGVWGEGIPFDTTYKNLHLVVSEDFGRTWSAPIETSVWSSNPFHAIRLMSGNVLTAYGWRREPYGIRVRLTGPELLDISKAGELILRDDSNGLDLGYPHCVQLASGDILVTYYITGADGIRSIECTVLRED